jgi:16S rRNA A1518/A1519 N6-dimethyltransferase RsmA/KsgA/DIM1 with predicted DNA glycosylase/AP lyase activity
VHILRDEAKILPLQQKTKTLLIEQVNPLHKYVNSQECHPGILWERMLEHSENVAMVEVNAELTENDKNRVMRRLDECNVIVTTNYYYRRNTGNNEFIKELHKKCGKPIIVIANTPYSMSALPEYKTVILTYGVSPESISEVAKSIFCKNKSAI